MSKSLPENGLSNNNRTIPEFSVFHDSFNPKTINQNYFIPEGLKSDQIISDILKNIPEIAQHYQILKKIGEGTYSKVYMACDRHYYSRDRPTHYALKYLLPIVKPSRISREIKTLRDLKGECNIIPLTAVFHGNGHIVMVMPMRSNHRFSEVYQVCPFNVIRNYMKNILIAVARVHQNGIVHRDIKPSNFVYDFRTGVGSLVDFGLSQHESDIKRSIIQYRQKIDRLWKQIEDITTITNQKENNIESFEQSNNQTKFVKRKLSNDDNSSIHSSVNQDINKNVHFNHIGKNRDLTDIIFPFDSDVFSKKRSPLKELIPGKNGRFFQSFAIGEKLDIGSKVSQMNILNKSDVQTYHAKIDSRVACEEDQLQFPINSDVSISNMKENSRSVKRSVSMKYLKEHCSCRDRVEICYACYSTLREFYVPRAGTPGFRAPEVLLRSSSQTCKIDIWSVGTIFISFLSARYPFFQPMDDLDSLAQIIELFGSERITKIAKKMNRTLVLDREVVAMDLRHTVQRLRDCITRSNPTTIRPIKIPNEAFELLDGLLDPDPETRFTAKQALAHPFFNDTP